MYLKPLTLVSVLFFSLIFCPYELHARNVSIMAYNTENLFDAIDDPGKDDCTFLPLSEKQPGSDAYKCCKAQGNPYYVKECLTLDWTPEVAWQKVKNIAYMVRSYRNFQGPDIVVFEEVEKIEILQAMVANELADLGYKTIVLIEGPDERGIDIGLISRFPLAGKPILHPVDLTSVSPRSKTRGILEVPLKIDDKKVVILGNHWPSQGQKPQARMLAAAQLIANTEKNQPNSLMIALGDFNTTDDENPSAINEIVLKPFGDFNFMDTYSECQKMGGPYCINPPGSYYYKSKKEWNRLDRIFLSNSFLDAKVVTFYWTNFVVYAPPFAINEDLSPLRFDPKTGLGFSDHFPVTMEFEIK